MSALMKPRNILMCFLLFALAIPLGMAFSFSAPRLAGLYIALVESRVFTTMGTPPGVPLGFRHVLIIIANNLVPVAVAFSFPPLLAAYNLNYATRHPERYSKRKRFKAWISWNRSNSRLSSELYLNLSLFAYMLSFMFGLFVFGIFFGYLLLSGGTLLLWKGVRAILPHSPFEVAAVLMSTSVALSIRDALLEDREYTPRSAVELKRRLWRLIKSRSMALFLASVIMLVAVGAFVEVYVSAPFARGSLFFAI
jgi:uncharacterized membrane protein SpoIIM required for sporulation